MNELRYLFGVLGIMIWGYGILEIDPPLSYVFAIGGGMLIGFCIWHKEGGW